MAPPRVRELQLGDYHTHVEIAEEGLRTSLAALGAEDAATLLVFDETTARLFGPGSTAATAPGPAPTATPTTTAKTVSASTSNEGRSAAGAAGVILPAGEAAKTFGETQRILSAALARGLPRSADFVAVGGGALTDVVGFAASLYMRGVSAIFIPTTLLGMVDAAVGGKTGINYEGVKNMVGTFYPAREVRIFLDALESLDDRQFRSGLAEVIKAGLLNDEAVLRLLEDLAASATKPAADGRTASPLARLRGEPATLLDLVDRAIAVKAEIVERDFREGGLRAHLNLGHTFAHAMESTLGLGAWTHGDAVAWGICRALDLGLQAGGTDAAYRERVYALLDAFGFHTGFVDLDNDALIAAMRHDKKRSGSELRFVLQRDLGDTFLASMDEAAVREVLG
jgi:3-dehydroquinate synthase